MAEQRMERRLSAILAADIAGYSALMGADEARTVRDLKGHQAVVLPMIGEFAGRIIDTAGDGILAEFPSVVNAVECAVAIQTKMAERNAAVEPARRMQFRVGINIGDVVYDDVRIYGDGINVAARLEGIAEAGGICISGKVYDEIDGQDRSALPGHRRAAAQEHRAAGACLSGTARWSIALPGRGTCACAARQAIDRRLAVPEHERRCRSRNISPTA